MSSIICYLLAKKVPIWFKKKAGHYHYNYCYSYYEYY